jgi:DNA-binding NarL/FixJ family response regulator
MDTSKIIVWIVEDNANYRKDLAALISQSDELSCVFQSDNCEEAISHLERNAPPDVILLDIGLPGMSGIEGIGRIKSLAPSVHVIILTVYDDDQHVFDAICAGASGYLLKTSSLDFIIASLFEVLRGGAPINSQIAKKVLDQFTEYVQPREDYGLTSRELEILQLLIDGQSKQRIADTIYLSPHTVDSHIRNIYTKLQVHSRSGAIAKAIRNRLV